MKNLTMLFAIGVTLITACNKDKIREFIPGTYVNSDGSTYSIAHDTLVIEPSENRTFFIHRKTGFRIIKNRKPGKREYETEEWSGLYDESTNSIREMARGKLITFYTGTGTLKVGKREYKKIN
ncbi:hypothetical protein ABIB40_003881 [Pedobacter sp. UYP30]|uniref:hypothetical protein n=1 Tax=Pedobacter sp. UYP30 TaxID=1756400 RepID=UPI0033953933